MLKRIKNWYRGLIIKNKIIVIFLPLSIVPLIIIGYLAISIYNNTMIERTRQNMLDNASLIQMGIDSMIQDTVNCSNMLLININKYLGEYNYDFKADDLTFKIGLVRQFNDAMIIYPQINSIYIVSDKYTIYTTDRKSDVLNYKWESSLIDTIKQSGQVDNWFQIQRRAEFSVSDSEPVMTLGKKIINLQSGKILGILMINIKESTLSSLYNNQKYQKNSDYYIINSDGKYMSTVNKNLLFQRTNKNIINKWVRTGELNEVKSAIDGKSLMISLPFNNNEDWFLVSESRLWDVMEDTKRTIATIIVAVFICILFIFIGTNIVMRYITGPINKIKEGMTKLGNGNFDVTFEIKSRDEIGLFAKGFNTMAGRIKELLDKIKIEQQNKRAYELALMQNQIKPHFLYNCLDQIYVLVAMDKKKTAQNITKKLADFYRVTLSQGKEIISLRDELKNVNDYLEIQKIRYQEFLNYDISYNDSIGNFYIPKLTLQPIVENAIYHGIKEKDGMGFIKILCKKDGNNIIIDIVDNGVGMSSTKLKQIFQVKPNEKEHFGLKNIKERLALYYDYKGRFEIHSEEGKGTKVSIVIPLEEENND